MRSVKKYIHHLRVSNKETKNIHALSWAFIFTLIVVIIYSHFFYSSKDIQSINQSGYFDNIVNIFSNRDEKSPTIKITNDDSVIYNYNNKTTRLGSDIYNLYLADTDQKRVLGLSGTKRLCDKCGLLFIFDNEDYLGFWMKDMLFNIDLIFLDKDGYIVDIYKDLSPQTYPKVFYSSQLTKYAIELNSGDSTKLNLQKGDKIDF